VQVISFVFFVSDVTLLWLDFLECEFLICFFLCYVCVCSLSVNLWIPERSTTAIERNGVRRIVSQEGNVSDVHAWLIRDWMPIWHPTNINSKPCTQHTIHFNLVQSFGHAPSLSIKEMKKRFLKLAQKNFYTTKKELIISPHRQVHCISRCMRSTSRSTSDVPK